MPETAPYNENDPSELYRLATEKLHQELVGTKQREELIIAALRRKDRLAESQNLGDYISGEMHFGESIQGLAFAMFCEETPPPYDSREVNERFSRDKSLDVYSDLALKWDFIPLTPQAREDQLRLGSLGISAEDPGDLENTPRPASIHKLVSGIIDSAGIAQWMGRHSSDPEQFRTNQAALQQLLACEPQVIDINGEKHWAIKIPYSLRDEGQFWRQQAPQVPDEMWRQFEVAEDMLDNSQNPPKPGEYPRAHSRSLSDYIVVADSERNADLSTFVFANDEALEYMTSKYLGKAQLKLKHKIEFDFNRIVEENIWNVQEIVEEINDPVRIEFFDRLLADAEGQEIEIISIRRNNQDTLAFQGEQYEADPTESSSAVDRYSVQKIGREVLLFSWPTQDLEGHNVTANVKVRNVGGRFEFANVNMDNEGDDLNDFSQKFGLNVRKIEEFINTIGIVTVSDWFRYGEKQRVGLRDMADALRACKGSVEFMNKLQEFGKANFPRNQIIVNPGRKVRFDIDTSKPPSMLRTQWN